jgi:M6 family metalloprotease-like protein
MSSPLRAGGALPPGGSRWEVRRRQARDAPSATRAPPQRKTQGKFVGLCLLVDFPDVPGTIPAQEVEAFCNEPGYSGFGNRGSVRDYFLDVSSGKLDYSNVVMPYYTAKHARNYYTDEKIAQPRRARALIQEALVHWKKQGFDFSPLKADTEGYVYATNVFHAGARVNAWSKGLWPHAYHLRTKFALGGGKFAHDYQITDMADELTLGTFCHENGHMVCDFPDLYDYGGESAGVGAFCLMCGGANADEKNPTHVGAYLKYCAGWTGSLTTLEDGMELTAAAGQNQFFVHRKAGNTTEYFIVENRLAQGRDAALPASGLAIWHVDELASNQHEQMTAHHHYECALKQADGRFDLERDPANPGDAGDLFVAPKSFGPATSPSSKWWDGSDSKLTITSIGKAGEAVAFKVKLG